MSLLYESGVLFMPIDASPGALGILCIPRQARLLLELVWLGSVDRMVWDTGRLCVQYFGSVEEPGPWYTGPGPKSYGQQFRVRSRVVRPVRSRNKCPVIWQRAFMRVESHTIKCLIMYGIFDSSIASKVSLCIAWPSRIVRMFFFEAFWPIKLS